MTPDQLSKIEARADSYECLALVTSYRKLAARAAVLREVVAKSRAAWTAGKQPHDILCNLLDTIEIGLHPAATALTERLRAAEAVCLSLGSLHSTHRAFDALAAWRKLKGEP